MVIAATQAAQAPASPLDELLVFLPPGARQALQGAIKLLEGAHVDIEALTTQLFVVAESVLDSALRGTTDALERAIEQLYERGVMERLGDLNSFARDGAEIGVQLGLNTLKAMTPGDLAKLLGLGLVAWLAPQLLVLNAPAFAQIIMELLTKLWNLP